MRGFRVGLNHNVHYKGRIFHVQSEDMGCRYAYAITHVFNDLGRVVKTRKLSYAQFQADAQVMTQIRELLRAQHTRVVEEVAQGLFDEDSSPASPHRTADPPGSLMPMSGVRPASNPEATAPRALPLTGSRRHISRA